MSNIHPIFERILQEHGIIPPAPGEVIVITNPDIPAKQEFSNPVRLQALAKPRSDLFSVGDSFTTEDGVRVHVMEERRTEKGRQFLYKGGGTAIWAADTAFRRLG